MERCDQLFINIKEKSDLLDTAENAGAAVAGLHGKLNTTVHRVLTDEIFDPAREEMRVVIDADSIGMLDARLLECIADFFDVPCTAYKRP